MTGDPHDEQHPSGESTFLSLEDGRMLHYRLRGTGTPTVIFESGMGFSGSIWGLVQPEVAAHATTIVYDRAGSGRSSDDSAPRTLARICDDLRQLLRTLQGPFILVGASWGGPIVRTVAATGEFPIRGLVLVDQSDERAGEYFSPAGERRVAMTGPIMTALARTGLYQLAARLGREQPAAVYADFRQENFGIRGVRMMTAEMREFLPAMRDLHDQPQRLEGIEVAVISGTKAGFMDRAQREAINRAHRATASAVARGRFVEAPNSGHYVMFTDPEIVVREILRMLPGHAA
ncbi:MAG: alpha/beta hydrolase [Thermomicrobiales bacterium]